MLNFFLGFFLTFFGYVNEDYVMGNIGLASCGLFVASMFLIPISFCQMQSATADWQRSATDAIRSAAPSFGTSAGVSILVDSPGTVVQGVRITVHTNGSVNPTKNTDKTSTASHQPSCSSCGQTAPQEAVFCLRCGCKLQTQTMVNVALPSAPYEPPPPAYEQHAFQPGLNDTAKPLLSTNSY